METKNNENQTIAESYPVESVRSYVSRQGDDVRKYRRGIIDVLWVAKPLADERFHTLMFRVAAMPDVAGLMFTKKPRIAFKDGSSIDADSMSTTDLKMVKEGLDAHLKRLLEQKRTEREQKAGLEKHPSSTNPEFYRNIREKNGYVFPTAWADVKPTDIGSLLAGKLKVVFFDSDESSIGFGLVPSNEPLLMEYPSGKNICFLYPSENGREWTGRYLDSINRKCHVGIDMDDFSMRHVVMNEDLADAIIMETRCADLLTEYYNRISPDGREKVYSSEEIRVRGIFFGNHNEILAAAKKVIAYKEVHQGLSAISLEAFAKMEIEKMSPSAKIQFVDFEACPTFSRMHTIQETGFGNAEGFQIPFHDQVVGNVTDFTEQMKVTGRYEGCIAIKDGDSTEHIICEVAPDGKGVVFSTCMDAYADMMGGYSDRTVVVGEKAYDVDNKAITELADGRTVELRCRETGEYATFAYSIKERAIVPSSSFEERQKENLKRKEDTRLGERPERSRSESRSKGIK